jgi:ribosomal protein S18 acetylase RimI-like enzyme
VPRALRTSAALEGLHPEGPHHFLSLLGTRRAARGQGLATALVAPGVERALRAGVPVHLDTSRPENVAFYERLGFAVAGTPGPLAPGAPTTWAMRAA